MTRIRTKRDGIGRSLRRNDKKGIILCKEDFMHAAVSGRLI
jgi:hypothetical protein